MGIFSGARHFSGLGGGLTFGAGIGALGLLGMLLALPASQASAAGPLETDWVAAQGNKARAKLSAGSVAGKAYALIEIELESGWKTYWRNPGEAGLPPEFSWDGSKNLAKAEVFYPAPHRFVDKAGETIGYKESVVFPVEVTRADANAETALAATVQYGVCKDVCIPAEAEFSLTLPAGALPEIEGDVLAKVPRDQTARRPGDPDLIRAAAIFDAQDPRIEIEVAAPKDALSSLEVFLDAEGGVYVPSPEAAKDLSDGHRLYIAKLAGAGLDVAALKERAIRVTAVASSGASTTLVVKNR